MARAKIVPRGTPSYELVPRQLEEQYSVRLVLITASVTVVSSFSLQMGSFAIGTAVAATAASLIFTALLASGDAALGKYFLKLVEALSRHQVLVGIVE